MEYLLRWRMGLAKEALLHGRGTLDEIAAQIGYKSRALSTPRFDKGWVAHPANMRALTRVIVDRERDASGLTSRSSLSRLQYMLAGVSSLPPV
jgi:AraC-like DNA-binding protein